MLLLAIVVLPASFIMGFSFPVVQKAVQRDLDRLGSRVGFVQLANIVGNSAGSLVAGLLLLDLVGTAGTLKLLVAIGLAFAVLQLVGPRADALGVSAGRGAGGGPGCSFPAAKPSGGACTASRPRRPSSPRTRPASACSSWRAPKNGQLYIQGHSQSRLPFDTVHAFLGAIGPLTHEAPKRVLVIGSGTGGTPYAAGLNPATEQVKVIEIVAPVIDDAADATPRRAASRASTSCCRARRFDVVVADGRHALALDPTRYDVIEADAILPKTALSGLLNSREFFRAGAGPSWRRAASTCSGRRPSARSRRSARSSPT